MKYKLIAGCFMFVLVGVNATQCLITGSWTFLVPLGMCFLSGCIFIAETISSVREEAEIATESEDPTS